MGAIVRSGATNIIIDNAKGHGRHPRIESACLERSITDPILSFRRLGKSVSSRAENSHIFCITANTPDVVRDLVTRCIVINLYYEGDPERREFLIVNPESYAVQYRREFAELIAVLVDHPQGTWMASELVELCDKRRLLAKDLGDGSPRSLATKMGTIAGRFVTERFPLDDGRQVVFRRTDGR